MAASLSAKTTLAGSAALSAFIVWGVHYLQIRERHASLRSSAATVKKADGSDLRQCIKASFEMKLVKLQKQSKGPQELQNSKSKLDVNVRLLLQRIERC